jgi:uncharacterized protein YjbI with pentapeptide repeats
MSYQVSGKKQILLGVIFLAVILVVLEIGANVWWYGLNTCPYEENEMFSHLEKDEIEALCNENLNLTFMDDRVLTSSEDSISINSEGFRGAEFSPIKPNNTYRIVMIGGSTTFGMGVFDNETVPFQLEQKFQSETSEFNVEVINAGIGGSWSKLEVDLIKNRIIDYDPNLLIVYDGANDALVEIGEILDHDPEANSELWKNRWIEICDIGNDTSYKTLLVLQPILGTGDKMYSDQEYTINTSYGNILNQLNHLDSYASQLDEINKHCAATADFRNIFDDVQEPIYYDIVHLGAKGNEIVANKIYDLAVPLIDLSEISNSDLILLESSKEKVNDEKNSIDSPFSYKTLQVISYLLGYQNRFSDTSQIDLDLSFKGKKIIDGDFSNKDLKKSIFYYSDLSDSSFENTNLQNSDFSYSTLKNINFKNSNLEGVNFRNAIIDNADFTGANIDDTQFSRSKISNTDLTNIDFKDQQFHASAVYNSDLTNATFENIDFTGSFVADNILDGTTFRNSDFSDSLFVNANLTTVDFTGSKFFKTSFYDTDFTGTDFSNMDIQRASFAFTILKNINFKNTDLTGVDLTGKIYQDTLLPGSLIDESDLSNTDMSKMLFSTSTLDQIPEYSVELFIIAPTITNSNLSNVNLSNVIMPYLIIHNSNLSSADLSNADLTNAELRNVDLSGANLNGANLKDANIMDVKLDGTMLNCVNHSICN